tara:strand:- start:1587 stop:2393 length:807 start_codon:yes stop_codon:yes gene_type:complete
MLGKGGQKNSAPYTKPMGNHVTFYKQLEEVEEESFSIQSELQPDLWDGDKLNDEVRERLLEIAEDFMSGLEVEADIEDIRFTGSLANYNWSKYSDIDLHIVADFSKINNDTDLVKAFFDAARMRWNDLHDIMIKGYEVEIYVENVNEKHKSTGIYSLTDDEWIKKPEPESKDIDFETADKKARDYADRAEYISREIITKEQDFDRAIRMIERAKQKIRDMRKAGLESEESEFSPENIAFKILRRDGVLDNLTDLKQQAYDAKMSLSEE